MHKLLLLLMIAVASVGCHHTPSAKPSPLIIRPANVRSVQGTVIAVVYRYPIDTDTEYSPELTSVIIRLVDGTTERLSFPEQGDLQKQFPNGALIKIEYTGTFHVARLIKVTVLQPQSRFGLVFYCVL